MMLSQLTLMCLYTLSSILPFLHAIRPLSIHEIKRRQKNTSKQSKNHAVAAVRLGNSESETRPTTEGNKEDVKELYFQQRLDHYRSYPNQKKNDTFTFPQRFFYSSRFLDDSEASDSLPFKIRNQDDVNSLLSLPAVANTKRRALRNGKEKHSNSSNKTAEDTFAFLCVGGEGPSLTKRVLIDSVHCTGDMIELASKLHKEKNASVHLFALEHRYYGNSYPTFSSSSSSAVSNKNLQYLSSRQALMDVANFVQFVKDEYDLDENIKFITFGGSYPGMLAGWSRLKFPHLIYGAVSNSAPVQVVINFYEYNDVVATSLKNPMVGGSNECYDIVQHGHEEIISTLNNNIDAARKIIADRFNICGGSDVLLDVKNLNVFLGDGVIYIPAQENDPSCEEDLCNIAKVCSNLTSSTLPSSMDKLATIAKSRNQDECLDISWENMISFLSSERAKVEGTRSWLWQTCTEMGFYQTCPKNSTQCPYGRGYHEFEQDLEICERAFGIPREVVPKNVQETMNNYGGWHMAGSRILSVNGDIDPWSALSMTKSGVNTTDLPSYWSIGASHHFWTHEVKESDGDSIQMTRDFIHNWVISLLYSKESQ